MAEVGRADAMITSIIDDSNEKSKVTAEENQQIAGEDTGSATEVDDPDIVRFSDNDPENPFEWSPWRKWPMLAAVASMSMVR